MTKFTLVLLVIMLILFGIHQGWFGVLTHSSQNKSSIQFSVDKSKLKCDVKSAEDTLKEKSRELKEQLRQRKLESATPQPNSLSLSKSFVVMPPDSKTQVVVRRSGDNSSTSLSMAVTPTSYLRVSGGDFREGQHETTVFIEALPEAKDGDVVFETCGAKETLRVHVSNTNRSVFF